MKYRFFKLLSVLILALSLVLALAACGGEDKDDGKNQGAICQHRDMDDNGKCDKCGANYTDGIDVQNPAGNCQQHVPGTPVVENLMLATCTQNATCDEVVYCTVSGCRTELSRTTKVLAPANGHTPGSVVIENAVDATCSREGSYDEVVYCSVSGCGHVISRNTTNLPIASHIDNNGDRKCDVCDIPLGNPAQEGTTESGEILPAVTWGTTTTLLFQMTDDSNNGELSSGCRRFLSGESDGYSTVEIEVRERNTKAMNYANVNVEYAYYTDGSHGWGRNITAMWNAANSDTATGRPDIFCNFVYDMVSASLLKSFKNLYNNTYASEGVKSGENLNYFSFQKDGKYDTTYRDTGDGYMIEYMQSLTLSEEKMYLLASDYFTDLVRAFFVVPVNVSIMESGAIPASNDPTAYNYDANQNGKYDMYDFYELVKAGKWTYDAVKFFSDKVYIMGPADNILDENSPGRYGFVAATGGLTASGLLYTTSVTIIERSVELVPSTDPDSPTGTMIQQYCYDYPDYADHLNAFATELANLFCSTGVAALSTGLNTTASTSEELEVRRAFAAGQVLFGGIVCVGSLEESVYADMSANGGKGFGVVPVPLFRTAHEVTNYDGTTSVVNDEYKTSIHNIGRIGAIAHKSTKFAQCSAFLNYQSLNSARILDNYYNLTLKTDAAGSVEGNAEMLDYIRAHVGSDFEKVFEDAIARHALHGGDSALNENKWHNIILDDNYIMPAGAMQSKYASLIFFKDSYLQQIAQSYATLP